MYDGRAFSWLAWLVVANTAYAGKPVEPHLPGYGPVVNLGYATYEGYYDDAYELNIWKRYRIAADVLHVLPYISYLPLPTLSQSERHSAVSIIADPVLLTPDCSV